MSKNNSIFFTQSTLICTDGSTLKIPFIYPREDITLNPDIKSAIIYLPQDTDIDLEGLGERSTKFKKYDFNFASIINK